MKRFPTFFHPLILAALLIGGGSLLTATAQQDAASPDAAQDDSTAMLRHVVMFEFKESSSEADVQKVVDAFRALPKKIPQIADFEYGTNNSPEGLNDGLTHAFLVSFKTEKDREIYLPHEAHKAFVEVLKPHLKKVVVIDYWADK